MSKNSIRKTLNNLNETKINELLLALGENKFKKISKEAKIDIILSRYADKIEFELFNLLFPPR